MNFKAEIEALATRKWRDVKLGAAMYGIAADPPPQTAYKIGFVDGVAWAIENFKKDEGA